MTAPPCIVIRLLGRKASDGTGGGGDGGGDGGDGGGGLFARRGADCWQRLHLFTGSPLSFLLLPFLFTQLHVTVALFPDTIFALQRAFFLPGPPKAASTFLPCFRWTPLHLSPAPMTRPLERFWQVPRRAWPTLLKWQLSSNLQDLFLQLVQSMVPLTVGHAAGAADAVTKRHTAATSASSTRQARRAGVPRHAAWRAILSLGSASSLAPPPPLSGTPPPAGLRIFV